MLVRKKASPSTLSQFSYLREVLDDSPLHLWITWVTTKINWLLFDMWTCVKGFGSSLTGEYTHSVQGQWSSIRTNLTAQKRVWTWGLSQNSSRLNAFHLWCFSSFSCQSVLLLVLQYIVFNLTIQTGFLILTQHSV